MKEEIKEGYKKTEIGIIPEDWEVKRLGELGSIYNGLSGKNKSDFGSGKPFIPYKNVFDNSKININYLDYVIIRDNEKQNRVKYGDIFFTTSSETPDEVGMSSVVLDEIGELYLNSFCFGFRLHNFDTLLPQFARYLLRGCKIRKNISKLAQGSTRFNLSKTQLLKISIPIPPLKEQQKIASILSTVDEHIEQTDKLIEKTKELKKGLMQKIFSQEIRLKNENGENYPNWEEKRLGDCITHFGGKALEKYVSNEGTYKFISIGNYSRDGKYIDNNQRILLNEKTKDKLLNKNDLVMILNDKTLTGDIIGATILIDEDNKYIYNQRSERIICNNNILPKYMWLMLNSESFRKKVFSISQGGTQIYVNFSNVKKLIVKIPSLKEQQKIASILSEVDNQIEEYELKKEKLQTLKKGLMQQLLTGKIRVKV